MATVYVTEQDLKDRFGDSEVGLLAELGPVPPDPSGP